MKYSEVIQFNPIEDVIQLTSADDAAKAQEYVQTYVMSDTMASNLKTLVIDQLQMDEVIDNKGVLIVGNYGSGKSHLMSVISAVANDVAFLPYLTNKHFAQYMECVAGKFEVLRFEFTGITMSLREFVLETISEDFQKRGIDYELPDLAKVRDNKKLMQDVMMAFSVKYPEKGYLLVVDELLNFLASRNAQQLVLDLEFLRVLGEMCSKSKLRVIFGMQEKLFDNPKFSFVADTLGHVRDRITEMTIAKEDTAYVVSQRILQKTPEQKAQIRAHLEQFSGLYAGMANRMDEFVDMFPIHPAYIDVFNKLYLIENRHVLKNISVTIQEIFNEDLPENAPGIVSFDNYWPKIKQTPMLRTEPEIRRVLDASEKLEDIITHAFPKAAYKPIAIQIIYALSVHRLTTNGLDVQFGMTAENLKDELCLYLPMPEQDADFLLGVIHATLKDILATVSGQFIVFNDANNQYYIDVDKIVDYDEKVKQRSSLISEDELNHAFYKVVYSCLEWDAKQYVTGFEIYERDLNWDSHNIFREGYLFMGLPGERSTAQPERDFYIHFMPPYDVTQTFIKNLPDEVYFYFKSTTEFREQLELYAAANDLVQMSEGKDKDTYLQKASNIRKKLIKFLSENKNTCFDVQYSDQKRQLIEVLRGRYKQDMDFKDTIDLAASICLDDYFVSKYPDFPVMRTKITRKNMAENVRQAFDYYAGRKTSLAASMLQSFGILEGEKIRPESSKYAVYYINVLKKLPAKGVVNYSDIFELKFMDTYEDKRFHIGYTFTPIIFLSLVYGGYATITLKNGTELTASNLDHVPKIVAPDLYEFKYLSRPAKLSMAELKKLFDVIDLNPALLDNPKDRDECVKQLLAKAQELSNTSVIASHKLQEGFELWGEPLVSSQLKAQMQNACNSVRDEFSNYTAKYNTPARLNNFSLTAAQIDGIAGHLVLIQFILEYDAFRTNLSSLVSYIMDITLLNLGVEFQSKLEKEKDYFRKIRDSISNGRRGEEASRQVSVRLEQIKEEYISAYFEEHQKKRLNINEAKRRGRLQESKELSNLRKLKNLDILSGVRLTDLQKDIADLKVCYELTPSELKTSYLCPHCRFRLGEDEKNIAGQLENLEDRLDDLTTEWINTLRNTISDPLVESQKEYLSAEQRLCIETFSSSGELPEQVDDFFVESVQALLQGFEPVVIDPDELAAQLDTLGPCELHTFQKKLNEFIDQCAKGKDSAKVRIVVKRKDKEV